MQASASGPKAAIPYVSRDVAEVPKAEVKSIRIPHVGSAVYLLSLIRRGWAPASIEPRCPFR